VEHVAAVPTGQERIGQLDAKVRLAHRNALVAEVRLRKEPSREERIEAIQNVFVLRGKRTEQASPNGDRALVGAAEHVYVQPHSH